MSPGGIIALLVLIFVVLVVIDIERSNRRADRELDAMLAEMVRKQRQKAAPLRIGQHWQTLGIAPTRDKQAVIKAFKKRALVVHPDKGGSNAAFLKLSEARTLALKECA